MVIDLPIIGFDCECNFVAGELLTRVVNCALRAISADAPVELNAEAIAMVTSVVVSCSVEAAVFVAEQVEQHK